MHHAYTQHAHNAPRPPRPPQNLVEYIVRQKVYQTVYWKESCFALTAETLIDKAVDLKAAGGTYGGQRKPTNFMCLILKMLQIQPDKEIIIEYIRSEDFKYVRLLGECGWWGGGGGGGEERTLCTTSVRAALQQVQARQEGLGHGCTLDCEQIGVAEKGREVRDAPRHSAPNKNPARPSSSHHTSATV